jgi:hypothetical protein
VLQEHPSLSDLLPLFRESGFEFSVISTQWFLLAFLNALPSETTLRVWDLFFSFGPRALFAAALGTLQLLAPTLRAADGFEQIYMSLKDVHAASLNSDVFVRWLLPELREIDAPRLERLRSVHLRAVLRENEQREAARRAYAAKDAARKQGQQRSKRALTLQEHPTSWIARVVRGALLKRCGVPAVLAVLALALALAFAHIGAASPPSHPPPMSGCRWNWRTRQCSPWHVVSQSVVGPCGWRWHRMRCA